LSWQKASSRRVPGSARRQRIEARDRRAAIKERLKRARRGRLTDDRAHRAGEARHLAPLADVRALVAVGGEQEIEGSARVRAEGGARAGRVVVGGGAGARRRREASPDFSGVALYPRRPVIVSPTETELEDAMPDVVSWIRALFVRRVTVPHSVDMATESWADVPTRPVRPAPPPIPRDARRAVGRPSPAVVDNEDWSVVIARAKAESLRTPLPLPLPFPSGARPRRPRVPAPPNAARARPPAKGGR
jgi:hypothetical protein